MSNSHSESGSVSESDSDSSDIDYEEEYKIINEMFPDLDFTISMSIKELNKVVTQKNKIQVVQRYNCYCYSDRKPKKKSKVFIIEGENITHKYILEQLINQGFKIKCNHRYYEGLSQHNNDYTFIIDLGS